MREDKNGRRWTWVSRKPPKRSPPSSSPRWVWAGVDFVMADTPSATEVPPTSFPDRAVRLPSGGVSVGRRRANGNAGQRGRPTVGGPPCCLDPLPTRSLADRGRAPDRGVTPAASSGRHDRSHEGPPKSQAKRPQPVGVLSLGVVGTGECPQCGLLPGQAGAPGAVCNSYNLPPCSASSAARWSSRNSIAAWGEARAINTLRGGPARAADAVSANGPFVMGVS